MSGSHAPPAAPGQGESPSYIRFAVLAWLCALAAIAYAQRNTINVAAGPIQEELGLSKEPMGWAMSAFFVGYALLQVPAGWLVDRWGSRKTLVWSTALCSLAAGLTALCRGFESLFAVRLVAGAGQAGIFPAATSSLARWFPARDRGLTTGLLTAGMSAGGAGATVAAGYLLEVWTWQAVFVLFAAPGIAWAVGFGRWFRDDPADHPLVSPEELALIRGPHALPREPHSTTRRDPTPWGLLLTSGSMWLINVQQFCRAAGYIFFATWFPTYLQESRGVSTSESGLLTSLPLVGVVIGSPLGGLVSDWLLHRTGSRRIGRSAVASVSMMICAALIAASYWVESPRVAVLMITAGSLVAAMAGPVAYAITIDMGGRHIGTVFSMMNMCGNLGAMAFPIVAAWLVERGGGWDAVLFLFAGLYVVAALCWLPVAPRGTVFDRDG